MLLDRLRKDEVLVDREMPDGYAIWKEENTMSPLREEDVNFSENDPLNDIFRKVLLALQKQNQPDTVYGILVSIKEKRGNNQFIFFNFRYV